MASAFLPSALQSTALQPASRDEWIMPVPAWQVMLDGQDLTEAMRPRLVGLTLTEKRGGEADSIEIILNDSDGAMAIPASEATLSVAIGWAQGSGVTARLVAKGSFIMDEPTWDGPPDMLTLTGRAADLTAGLRKRRDESWIDQPISAIMAKIAQRNGLTPRTHALFASVRVPAMQQNAKSDIAFIRELGQRYDAVATVKAGTLIFAPIGIGTTAAGTPLPSLTITRAMTTGSCSWRRPMRRFLNLFPISADEADHAADEIAALFHWPDVLAATAYAALLVIVLPAVILFLTFLGDFQ